VITVQQEVELTEQFLRYEGGPEPPESLPDEDYRELLVEVAAFGSQEVAEAIADFRIKAAAFGSDVATMRTIRDHGGGDLVEAHQAVDRSRAAARDAFGVLQTKIR
jgi:hypothetical protein